MCFVKQANKQTQTYVYIYIYIYIYILGGYDGPADCEGRDEYLKPLKANKTFIYNVIYFYFYIYIYIHIYIYIYIYIYI